MEKALRDYFDRKYKAGDIHPKLWELTNAELEKGIDGGFGRISYEDDSPQLINELKTNAAVFAAFKNHALSKELVALLVDPDGKRRSWNEFRKEAAQVDEKYNKQWLEAEFNYATRAARSAQQWQEFERTKDLYPNLQYVASAAGTPRESHRQYYGVIKPVDDPFWDSLMPPNGWGCKCSVIKTRSMASSAQFDPVDPIPGIPGNAGKARQVFTPSHPFVSVTNKMEKLEIARQFQQLNKSRKSFSIIPVAGKKIKIHVRADLEDLSENVNFAVAVVKKYKKDMQIREHSFDKGIKNPEFLYDKTIGDRYSMRGKKNIRRFVTNAFDEKLKEGKQLRDVDPCFIGIDFAGKLNLSNMADAASQLYPKLLKYKQVKFVLLKNGDKVVRIDNKGQSAKELLETIRAELK